MAPLSLPLSRIAQRQAIRGERRRIGRNADPGRREGLLSSLALGYFLTPLQGSQDEAAASLPLHFLKDVQSPASRERTSPRRIYAGAGIQNLADDGDAGLDACLREHEIDDAIATGIRHPNSSTWRGTPIFTSPVQEETEKDLQHRRPVSQR